VLGRGWGQEAVDDGGAVEPGQHADPAGDATNAQESLNYQLRKIIKNRGSFPNDDA
jgi:hypothetical protein